MSIGSMCWAAARPNGCLHADAQAATQDFDLPSMLPQTKGRHVFVKKCLWLPCRQMQKLPPTQAFVPPSMLAQTEALLAAYRAFEHNDMPCDVHGIAIGEDRRIGEAPLPCMHLAGSQASPAAMSSVPRQPEATQLAICASDGPS